MKRIYVLFTFVTLVGLVGLLLAASGAHTGAAIATPTSNGLPLYLTATPLSVNPIQEFGTQETKWFTDGTRYVKVTLSSSGRWECVTNSPIQEKCRETGDAGPLAGREKVVTSFFWTEPREARGLFCCDKEIGTTTQISNQFKLAPEWQVIKEEDLPLILTATPPP